MSRYYGLEDGTGHFLLEDGSGGYLLEDATLTSVNQTFTYKWDIRTFVSQVFTYKYDIREFVSKAFTYKYDIAEFVSKAFTYKYDIREFVSKVFIYKYDIVSFISKAFTYKYDIASFVSQVFNYVYDINDTGSSVLDEQSGTLTATQLSSLNNEVCFLTKTDGPRHYSIYVFVDNMASGDEIAVKIQIKDPVSGTFKSYDEEAIINFASIKSDVAPFSVFIPAKEFKVCLKQTKGTLRNYNWALYKSK